MKSVARKLIASVTVEQDPEPIVFDTPKERAQKHRLRRIQQARIDEMTSQLRLGKISIPDVEVCPHTAMPDDLVYERSFVAG